jgi:hypothetical protein
MQNGGRNEGPLTEGRMEGRPSKEGDKEENGDIQK